MYYIHLDLDLQDFINLEREVKKSHFAERIKKIYRTNNYGLVLDGSLGNAYDSFIEILEKLGHKNVLVMNETFIDCVLKSLAEVKNELPLDALTEVERELYAFY